MTSGCRPRDGNRYFNLCKRSIAMSHQPVIHHSQALQDSLLNDDEELCSGRDFAVYSQGMDASMSVKINDICPYVLAGKIVDKGCGTGTLLIHLSTLFADSQIVGVDLSRELLRRSLAQQYPNHNVSVVKANIIHRRFADNSLSTVIFSSVMHEVYSYTGYDRDQVRLALANTWHELAPHGRIIIRMDRVDAIAR